MKLCECGCGQPTIISTCTDRHHGWVKGEPRRFLQGHNNRLRRITHDVVDRGYETPCHISRGARNDRGYAMAFGGHAHRVLWEREHGPVPDGLELDHLCRQRDCIRLDHLEAVTHAENCRRGAAARPGVGTGGTAVWIREARRAAGLSQADLAHRLGVTQALISHWERAHCEPPPDRLEQVRREMSEGYGRSPEPLAGDPIGSRRAA